MQVLLQLLNKLLEALIGRLVADNRSEPVRSTSTLLSVLSGWAMHKPSTLPWLERLFVSYDGARIVHFACMLVLGSFVIPHVILVIADGFDTFRSMITGWSTRVKAHDREA